jgi:acyl-CoA carboxylase subunit beta
VFHEVVEEWDADLRGGDPLAFPGYREQLARLETVGESVRTGRTNHYAFVEGRFEVLGGSMGAVAGERVVRAYERAIERRLPVVVVTRTGGARMQEGMVSLIQLARTAGAARRHQEAGLLSLAVHAHPTTGGVLVSYGAHADLRAGVRGATLGFAGPRVAEAVVGQPLPEGSHTTENAHRHGLLDALVEPGEEGRWIEGALGLSAVPLPARSLPPRVEPAEGGAWGEVLRARAEGRPTGIDRAAAMCSSWTELRGADPVIRAGLATVAGRRVVVVATDRYAGHGRPSPAGYRLARRALALADRLRLPVLTLVDTPGADPSPEAEIGGIVPEIARTFGAMAGVGVPTVSVCVGEGGSGGALALAHADRLLIQEHGVFSVIGPEGAAAILERDASRAPEVAERLALTSGELLRLGIVDGVVGEGDDDLARAVGDALSDARMGERKQRVDEASRRWLR